MSITSKKKSELISEYCLAQNDTGSSFVQCAILTERVRNLTEHLKVHKKDSHSRLGLLILVARRRKLLKYIKGEYGNSRYVSLIEKLGIRDVCH